MVLLERHQGIHLRARRLIEKLQERSTFARIHMLQDVCGISRSEQTHPHAALAHRQPAHEFGLIVGMERQKKVVLRSARQSVELRRARSARYPAPTVCKVSGGAAFLLGHTHVRLHSKGIIDESRHRPESANTDDNPVIQFFEVRGFAASIRHERASMMAMPAVRALRRISPPAASRQAPALRS